ncbi:hypothetical protein FRC04_002834 [Tulasnella sp. 424]|nr:hypothetical protein FRC04_002834 [Tulasnella sp. 424]KAG8963782.1 hypothetical protein FRC05_004528 [Tulasnella sp. 425]
MSSFFVLPPHAAPASPPHHPPLALPIPDPQLAPPSFALHPTGSIPSHSDLHHSAHAAPVHNVLHPSTNALHDHSAALGAPRPRKKTSSVSKAIKAKRSATGAPKPPHNCVQGVKLATLQYPLHWTDIPCLGPIIPGPDPTFLSQECFSEDALPRPGWLNFALGALMTRKCKNPWEVTVTIAELQPWRVWMAGKGVTWHHKLSSAYDHASNVISLARLPKDASGYFDITDPTRYSLPQRKDKNKPKSQRRIFEDNEGGTAVAPSPNAIPALSPVTTGTSHSTVTTGPSTPAFQNGASDLVDSSQFDLFGQNDAQSSGGQTSSFQATSRNRLDQPVYSPTPAVSISTVIQPHTPALTPGPSGHSQLVHTPIIAFDQGYYMESLQQPVLQAPTALYEPSYQQVSGMDALLGAGSMTPLGAPPFSSSSPYLNFSLAGQPVDYASGEAFNELALYQLQNDIMDQFTYRS